MNRCIQLARNGLGTSYPNPLVGAVVVHENRILGEGWHKRAGEFHAEVIAIGSVKDRQLLRESVLYVNLEPCSHHGKTPPCADLIIEMGIKRVVIGSRDYHSKVNGQGIKRLQEAGCEVITGILEAECLALNKRFFTFHLKKRPYIILKWARTANGFISPVVYGKKLPVLSTEEKKPFWISNNHALQYVHQLRTHEQSILVGTVTARTDNPSLTARKYFGKNPLRLLIDKELKVDTSGYLFDGLADTVVFCEHKPGDRDKVNHIEYEALNFDEDIPGQICKFLYDQNIQSLVVEGGSKTLQKFIDRNLWDEAIIITGAGSVYKGRKAPCAGGNLRDHFALGDNIVSILDNENTFFDFK